MSTGHRAGNSTDFEPRFFSPPVPTPDKKTYPSKYYFPLSLCYGKTSACRSKNERREGTVTLWSHGSRSVCNIFSRKSHQPSTLIPTSSPSLLPVIQLEPIPLFFLTFWILYASTWISRTLPSVTASVTHGHKEIAACSFQAWIQL